MYKITLLFLMAFNLFSQTQKNSKFFSLDRDKVTGNLQIVISKLPESRGPIRHELEIYYIDKVTSKITQIIQSYNENDRFDHDDEYVIESPYQLTKIDLNPRESQKFFNDKNYLIVRLHNYPSRMDYEQGIFDYTSFKNSKNTNPTSNTSHDGSLQLLDLGGVVMITGDFSSYFYNMGAAHLNFYYKENQNWKTQYIKSSKLDSNGDFQIRLSKASFNSVIGELKVVIKNFSQEEISETATLKINFNSSPDPIDPDPIDPINKEEIKRKASLQANEYVITIFDTFSQIEAERRSAFKAYKDYVNESPFISKYEKTKTEAQAKKEASEVVENLLQKKDYQREAKSKAEQKVTSAFKNAARKNSKMPTLPTSLHDSEINLPREFTNFTFKSSIDLIRNFIISQSNNYNSFFNTEDLYFSALDSKTFVSELQNLESNFIWQKWKYNKGSRLNYYFNLSDKEKTIYRDYFLIQAEKSLRKEKSHLLRNPRTDYFTYNRVKESTQSSAKNRELSKYGQKVAKSYLLNTGANHYILEVKNSYKHFAQYFYNELSSSAKLENLSPFKIIGSVIPGSTLEIILPSSAFLNYGGQDFSAYLSIGSTNNNVMVDQIEVDLKVSALSFSNSKEVTVAKIDIPKISSDVELGKIELSLNSRGTKIYKQNFELNIDFIKTLKDYLENQSSPEFLLNTLDEEYRKIVQTRNNVYDSDAKKIRYARDYLPLSKLGEIAKFYKYQATNDQKLMLKRFIQNNLKEKSAPWYDWRKVSWINADYNRLIKMIK